MKLHLAFSSFILLLDSTSSFQVHPQLVNKIPSSPFRITATSINPRQQQSFNSISSNPLLILRSEKTDTTESAPEQGEGREELTDDELTLISAIAQTDTASLDSFLMTNLSNMPSHVILTPRDAADDKLPTYASKLSDNQCAHLKTVGKALVEIMDNNLKAGRDLLQDLLKCGEIRKLDAAIANAMKQDKIGMSFFTVLNMNIRDAAMEQVDEGSTLSKTEEGEFSTGDNANRYQILQHIYTRCQEEVEKTVSPGAGLLNKLLRTDQDTIRANQLRHYLCPQAPKTISSPDGKSVELPGSDALVKPSELIDALQNAVKQIRTVEKTGTVDVSAAAALVESCRQVAIEARLAVGEGYGIESEELKEFELSLQPVFRPDNADSEYIKGV
jgi:hypothetical protein